MEVLLFFIGWHKLLYVIHIIMVIKSGGNICCIKCRKAWLQLSWLLTFWFCALQLSSISTILLILSIIKVVIQMTLFLTMMHKNLDYCVQSQQVFLWFCLQAHKFVPSVARNNEWWGILVTECNIGSRVLAF